MKIYAFTLIVAEVNDAVVDAIYGRCPDSSIGGSHGTMYVAFDRKAISLEAALDSAIADLRELGVTPLRIEMDVPKRALV